MFDLSREIQRRFHSIRTQCSMKFIEDVIGLYKSTTGVSIMQSRDREFPTASAPSDRQKHSAACALHIFHAPR